VQHLPKALLLALLLGAEPAMAVDYLNCEAMQRAYARLVNQRVDFIIKNFKPAKFAKLRDLCRKYKLPDNPLPDARNDQAVERWLAIEEERFPIEMELITKHSKCLTNPENMAIAEAAAYKKFHPMNREKIAKVAADLKAAKCP
jgi:hypothetical protein